MAPGTWVKYSSRSLYRISALKPVRGVLICVLAVFLAGCRPGTDRVAPEARIVPVAFRMHIGHLKDREQVLFLDPASSRFSDFTRSSLPPGLDEYQLLTFMTDFYIPDSLKNRPLMMFVPAASYPLEIRVNNHLVYACGQTDSKTHLDKYFGERVMIAGTLLNQDGANRLTIQAAPRQLRVELPKVFFGSYLDVTAKTVSYSLGRYSLAYGFILLSFFFFFMFTLLWVVSGFENYSQLYFAIACFFLGAGYLFIIFSNAALNSLFLWRLSRFCFTSSTIPLLYFIVSVKG